MIAISFSKNVYASIPITNSLSSSSLVLVYDLRQATNYRAVFSTFYALTAVKKTNMISSN